MFFIQTLLAIIHQLRLFYQRFDSLWICCSINFLRKFYWRLNWFAFRSSSRFLFCRFRATFESIPAQKTLEWKVECDGREIFLHFRVVWVICCDKAGDKKKIEWESVVCSFGESQGDLLSSFDFALIRLLIEKNPICWNIFSRIVNWISHWISNVECEMRPEAIKLRLFGGEWKVSHLV